MNIGKNRVSKIFLEKNIFFSSNAYATVQCALYETFTVCGLFSAAIEEEMPQEGKGEKRGGGKGETGSQVSISGLLSLLLRKSSLYCMQLQLNFVEIHTRYS